VSGLSKVAALDLDATRRQWVLLIVCALLLTGCATLASSRLFPEITARQPPAITLSEIVELLPGPVATSAALIRADGTAAVIAVDDSRRVHYLAVANRRVVAREVLGTIENSPSPRLDIIEHRGELRVLAGDKQFFRAVSAVAWKETRGNRCVKFLPLEGQLFCAMVIKGEEIKSPERKDWTVGWFILFPVVFWSNETAAKLVIAQEAPEGWLMRAVIDGDSPLDAGMDFFAATDPAGELQLLFSASRGGGLFGVFVGTAPGAMAAGFSGHPAELRYARFSLRELLPAGSSAALARLKTWTSRSSARVENTVSVMPGDQVHPIYRRFAATPVLGVLHGLLWMRQMPMPPDASLFSIGEVRGWLNAQLDNGLWNARTDIVAVDDLPNDSFDWAVQDRFASMVNSSTGSAHALLETCSMGFWDTSCRLAYFLRTPGRWSAPLVLGSSRFDSDGRAIAVNDRDCAFATWVDADKKYVGRWIGRCDAVH